MPCIDRSGWPTLLRRSRHSRYMAACARSNSRTSLPARAAFLALARSLSACHSGKVLSGYMRWVLRDSTPCTAPVLRSTFPHVRENSSPARRPRWVWRIRASTASCSGIRFASYCSSVVTRVRISSGWRMRSVSSLARTGFVMGASEGRVAWNEERLTASDASLRATPSAARRLVLARPLPCRATYPS